MVRTTCIGILFLIGSSPGLFPGELNLPPRPADAQSGKEIAEALAPLSLQERETFIYERVAEGNIPGFLRRLVPVTVHLDDRSASYFVTPDYLALGSNEDYLLMPMTPVVAQRIADLLDCTLPTRKMVDQIWSQAPVKLAPSPIPPSAAMTTLPVFAKHNAIVRAQRDAAADFPPGTLVAGTKKDVVISRRIYGEFARRGITRPVVIYGWHETSGKPIQPLYNGHDQSYADYSHGIRLVQNAMTLDGEETSVTDVLQDAALAFLLSDEGTLPRPRYPTTD